MNSQSPFRYPIEDQPFKISPKAKKFFNVLKSPNAKLLRLVYDAPDYDTESDIQSILEIYQEMLVFINIPEIFIIKTKLEIFRYSLLDSYKYTTSKVKDLISKTYKHDNINIVVNTDKYSDDNKLLASRVLEDIGIETRFINKDIEDIKLPDRRKNLTNMQDFRVLDDSYNINPLSAKITIETALNSNYKNVVAIVGGIPEAGVKTKEFNYNLGYELNKVTHVYVLKSDFHKYIIEKLENDKYSLVNNIDEAWNQVIKNEDKSNTLVIHFPELTDLYY